MTVYYPLFLNIMNRHCIVIGAGDVAARKSVRLIECGARVTVVGRLLTPELARMRDEGVLSHIDDDYRSEHIEGAFLVIGATDDEAVNRRVHGDAEAAGLLVNIVDCPELCTFILPALVRKGDLAVAVSTGGKSPALARMIRMNLETLLDDGYGPLLRVLGNLRRRILARARPADENRLTFESLIYSPLMILLKEGRLDEARNLVMELTGEEMDPAELEAAQTGNNNYFGDD
ncbi:MAG: bifunctional precorrin-2 dehydrogenase/sirohydrochlorin ferrochelatase [Syntrophales bacterium]|nr:bifunctional precorrin-2 dehydrogenase/sirohydrochlorin ferrochelatase [Syntrophales bacterium]MCK9527296.1 bifunctional precorrin-2 dehydrogenase/sirohydrochlorin ferrochelatase [Syntrophales bacterium]MDX9921234.1 bifunctional precorrin-2 dehydrogenase/sirohydrochlorin ferrochelatase [Syntrophales bacterium]